MAYNASNHEAEAEAERHEADGVKESPPDGDPEPVDPLVIAHRGASAYRPEHTLEAQRLAADLGADFLEADLVVTADGVLVARHEPFLATVEMDDEGNIVFDDNGDPTVTFESTNVADLPEFADKLTIKELVPGQGQIAGWFAEDFTLDELKTLRAREDQPELRPGSALFDDHFEIATFDEVIALAQELETESGREVGLYVETKEPAYFEHFGTYQNEDANGNGTLDDGEDINGNGNLDVVNGGAQINVDTSRLLVQDLVEAGFTDPDRVFIQSFGVENLLELEHEIMPEAAVDLPLVQLFSGNFANPPADVAYHFGLLGVEGGDPSVYDSLDEFITAGTTFGDLATSEGLAQIAAYADGVGPSIGTVIDAEGQSTDLVEAAHDADLLIHPYTHRNDSSPEDPVEYYRELLDLGVDGVFTDNPDTGVIATQDYFLI